MKKTAALFTALIMILSLCACTGDTDKIENTEIEGCEISVIDSSPEMKTGSIAEDTWNSVMKYAAENGLSCDYFNPEEASEDGYLKTISKVVEQGAGMIVLPGSCFEETVYEAQKQYPEVYFLILDGVPHNKKASYEISERTTGIVFAEEEAGYLAGYAAVSEGFSELGFIGESKAPEYKRYGYGFIQGAAAAAAETETRSKIRYAYADSKASETAAGLAEEWYSGGTQIIFVCGDEITPAVIKTASSSSNKVISSDSAGSQSDDAVTAYVKKGIDAAVEKVVDGYADDRFIGGTAFNYAAKNNGIGLVMKDGAFSSFTDEQYDAVYGKLKNGKIQLKKDTNVKSAEELGNEWVSIE